ncbi:MAG: hypothetical protein A2Z03_11945 [Chloroflexi bacterium RBG_16_56_8]|nr:MAG: hypothetical protein A2Z03_11945 [Chloroflexi bacterium RBG_16_56_8]OHD23844.1 MAG: hypothetical protein A2Y38_17290 [Spirochaetes bacterium GWB1_59_5]
MEKARRQLLEFHRTFSHPVGAVPEFPAQSYIDLRLSLIDEEVQELRDAVVARDMVETADALGDIMYVVIGMAIALGIPIDKVFNEIHASNMTKLGEDGRPIYREDGKILKGQNFRPPNIKAMFRGDDVISGSISNALQMKPHVPIAHMTDVELIAHSKYVIADQEKRQWNTAAGVMYRTRIDEEMRVRGLL